MSEDGQKSYGFLISIVLLLVLLAGGAGTMMWMWTNQQRKARHAAEVLERIAHTEKLVARMQADLRSLRDNPVSEEERQKVLGLLTGDAEDARVRTSKIRNALADDLKPELRAELARTLHKLAITSATVHLLLGNRTTTESFLSLARKLKEEDEVQVQKLVASLQDATTKTLKEMKEDATTEAIWETFSTNWSQ